MDQYHRLQAKTAALAATCTPSRGGTSAHAASHSTAQHGLRPPLPSPSPRRGADTFFPQSPGTCATPRLTCPRKPDQQADLAHTPNYAGTKVWQPLKQDKPARSNTGAVEDAAALQGLVAAGAAAGVTPGARAGHAVHQEQVAVPALSGTQRHRAQQSANLAAPAAPAWATGSIAAPGSPGRRHTPGWAYSTGATAANSATAEGPSAPSWQGQRPPASMAAHEPSSSPVQALSPALQRSQRTWSPLGVPSPRTFQPTPQSSPGLPWQPGLHGSPCNAAGPEPAAPLAYKDILPNRVASVLPKAERHGGQDTSTAREAFFASLARTRPPTPPAPSSVNASPRPPAARLPAAAASPGAPLPPAQADQGALSPSTSSARPASAQVPPPASAASPCTSACSGTPGSSPTSSPASGTTQSPPRGTAAATARSASSASKAAGSSAVVTTDSAPRKPEPLGFRDVVHAVSASTGTGDSVSWDLSRQLLALRTANAMVAPRGPAEACHVAHAHPALLDLDSRIPPSMQHVAHVAATAASLAARGPVKPARSELQPMPLQSTLDAVLAEEPQRAGPAGQPSATQPAPAPEPAPRAHRPAAGARSADTESVGTPASEEREPAPRQAQRPGEALLATACSSGSVSPPPTQPARKSPGRFVPPQDVALPASPARAGTAGPRHHAGAGALPAQAAPRTPPARGEALQRHDGQPGLPAATRPGPTPLSERGGSMPAELAAALAAARAADATEAAAAAEFARSLRSQLAQLRMNLQALQGPAGPRSNDATPVARVRLQDE